MADRKPPPIPAKPVRHTVQMGAFDPATVSEPSAPATPPKIEAPAPPPPGRGASGSQLVRDVDRPLPPMPSAEPLPQATTPVRKPHPPSKPPPSTPATSPAPVAMLGEDFVKKPHPPLPRNASPVQASDARPSAPNTDDTSPGPKKPHPPAAAPPGVTRAPHPSAALPPVPDRGHLRARSPGGEETLKAGSDANATDAKRDDKRSLTPEPHGDARRPASQPHGEKRNSGHRRAASVNTAPPRKGEKEEHTRHLGSSSSNTREREHRTSDTPSSSHNKDSSKDRERDREHHRSRAGTTGSSSREAVSPDTHHKSRASPHREHRDNYKERDAHHGDKRDNRDGAKTDHSRDHSTPAKKGDSPKIAKPSSEEKDGNSSTTSLHSSGGNSASNLLVKAPDAKLTEIDNKDSVVVPQASTVASSATTAPASPGTAQLGSKIERVPSNTARRGPAASGTTPRKHMRSRSTDVSSADMTSMLATLDTPPKPRPHPPPKPPPSIHVLASSQSAVSLSTPLDSSSTSSSALVGPTVKPSTPLNSSTDTTATTPGDKPKKPPAVPARPERVLRPQQGGSLISRPSPREIEVAPSPGAVVAPISGTDVSAEATTTSPLHSPNRVRRLSLDGTRSSNNTTEEQQKSPGNPPPEFAAQLLNILKDIKPRDITLPAGKPTEDIDAWPTQIRVVKKWPQIDAGPNPMLVINWHEYAVELGDPALLTWPSIMALEDEERCTAFYESALAKTPHGHWVARNDEHGAVVISIEKVKDRRMRVLIRTKRQDERMLLPPNSKKKLNLVLDVYPMYAQLKFKKLPAEKLQEQLTQFERKTLESVRYKFGVLYCKVGQKEEDQWYANQEKDQSPAFSEFLNIIGERIKIRGWDKFCGGLDNKYGTTGENSVYASHKGCEIMYHVSTLLPFYPDDVQQVERKRHLGNDVCLVVFRDKGCAPFDPMIIKSQFNHIFAVVEPDTPGKYRVQFAYKIGVNHFGPSFPVAPQMHNAAFRSFLLTKLVNGQRAAMYAPDFRGKTTRTRKTLLCDIVPEDLVEVPTASAVGGVVAGGAEAFGKIFRRTLFMGKGTNAAAAPAEV